MGPDGLGCRLCLRRDVEAVSRLWPTSFVGRAVAATMASLILAQALTLGIFFTFILMPQTQRVAEVMAQTFVTVSATVERLPPAERSRLLSQLSQSDYLDVWSGADPPAAQGRRPQLLERLFMQSLVDKLGGQRDLEWRTDASNRLWLHLAVGPELYWVSVKPPGGLQPVNALLAAIAVTLLLALATAVAAQRRLASPLGRLADAATALKPGVTSSLPETGPSEIAAVSKAFNAMTGRLAASERARAIMLAGVSHDIRTPLAKLRLVLEMVSDPDGELVQTARRQVGEIDRILGQFLAFGRGPEGEPETVFDLDALVDEVVAFHAADGVPIGREGVPIGMIRGRPEALRRAIVNLVQNALHYGAPPIVIWTARSGPGVTLAVRDHGPGVAPERLSDLDQPFVRGDSARSSPGTGLGLAIVANTMQAQGGTLILSNRDTVGFEARLEWHS